MRISPPSWKKSARARPWAGCRLETEDRLSVRLVHARAGGVVPWQTRDSRRDPSRGGRVSPSDRRGSPPSRPLEEEEERGGRKQPTNHRLGRLGALSRRGGKETLSAHAPTISCMVCWMNSLKESSCWRASPFSSKKLLMTVHASSCPISSSSSKSSPIVTSFAYRPSIALARSPSYRHSPDGKQNPGTQGRKKPAPCFSSPLDDLCRAVEKTCRVDLLSRLAQLCSGRRVAPAPPRDASEPVRRATRFAQQSRRR